MFRTCARSRGGPAVHLGPGRRGITCRSGGISGSFRQGIECKEDREVVMHRYQDGAATEQLQGRWVGVADEDPAWGMVKNPDQDSGR